jgi:Bacterial regulatory helix-turn-helix protein, lysR family
MLAEVDPSLVEAIEHPDPRQWISPSLRAENLLPVLAQHRLDPDGALQHRGEGSGEIVRRYACALGVRLRRRPAEAKGDRMVFDTRLLTGVGVLAAVTEAGNFARAAEMLGLTPSAVSLAVARLEARVGVRLFDRNPREVSLTEEGRLPHAGAASRRPG